MEIETLVKAIAHRRAFGQTDSEIRGDFAATYTERQMDLACVMADILTAEFSYTPIRSIVVSGEIDAR